MNEVEQDGKKSRTKTVVEKILEHHGVKGQRWGVRRRSRVTVNSSKLPKKFTSSDFNRTKALRGRKPSQLSNHQLKILNERMNLEKNYRKLNPTTINKGHNNVKEILAIAGTAAAAGALAGRFLRTPQGQKVLNKGREIVLSKQSVNVVTKAFPEATTFA